MLCPRCGAENVDSAGFCVSCGSQLAPSREAPSAVTRSQPTAYEPGPRGYAGFWKRVAAYIIDGIIINIAMTVVGLIVGVPLYARTAAGIDSIHMGRLSAYYLITVVVTWLYFTLLESSSQQATVGKMALGIVVTDLEGRRISFGQANARFWSKILSSIILLIGYIMAGVTERKQGLHDLIARTLVVNKGYR